MDSLTPEQIEHLKDVFHLLDKNGNDKIEIKELGDGLRAMGMNPSNQEIQDLIDTYDVSGDGALSFNEFIGAYFEFTGKTTRKQEELQELFDSLDINGDGKISREELREFLCSGGEPFDEDEIEKVFNEFDSDDNGYISFQELAQALMSK
jgi:Ca2+-binding EF-hand superfamily protein